MMTPLWCLARMPSPTHKPATPAAPDLKAAEIETRSAERASRLADVEKDPPVSSTVESRDLVQEAVDAMEASRPRPSAATRITGEDALAILAKYDRRAPAQNARP